jgi:GRF zinc finger
VSAAPGTPRGGSANGSPTAAGAVTPPAAAARAATTPTMSSNSGQAGSGSISSNSSSSSSSSGKAANNATTPVKANSSSSSSSSGSGSSNGTSIGEARAGSSSSSARNLGADFAAAAAAAPAAAAATTAAAAPAAEFAAPPKINKFRKGQHEPWPGWPERCLCGTAAMKRGVSHTAKNPGRVFVTCTNPACGKFDWLDPRCACGLVCGEPHLVGPKGQPRNRGRLFFKCSRSTCR